MGWGRVGRSWATSEIAASVVAGTGGESGETLGEGPRHGGDANLQTVMNRLLPLCLVLALTLAPAQAQHFRHGGDHGRWHGSGFGYSHG